MGRQARTSSSALTPMKWLTRFIKYSLEENFFGRSGLIGEGNDALIRIYKDLTVTKGNKVRIPMTGPLTGVGGGDNFSSEDIMEAYDAFYMDVEIHERGHTTGLSGPMTKQHMIEDWPRQATEKLASWAGVNDEKEIIKALSGLYNLSTSVESVNEHAPTTRRIAYGGETKAGVIEANACLADGTTLGPYAAGTKATTDALLSAETETDNLMGPNFLEKCVIHFMNSEPRPRLLTIDGRKCLLFIMTPWQGADMRQNTIYINRNQYAQVRGNKNPLLSDSMGFWNCGEVSVLLKEYGRMESRTGAGGTTPTEGFTLNTANSATSDAVASGVNVGRALLMGAGAGTIAYGATKNGQMIDRFNGDLDSGTNRKPFYGIDMIKGISKTTFDNESDTAQQDMAVMCIDTIEQH